MRKYLRSGASLRPHEKSSTSDSHDLCSNLACDFTSLTSFPHSCVLHIYVHDPLDPIFIPSLQHNNGVSVIYLRFTPFIVRRASTPMASSSHPEYGTIRRALRATIGQSIQIGRITRKSIDKSVGLVRKPFSGWIDTGPRRIPSHVPQLPVDPEQTWTLRLAI